MNLLTPTTSVPDSILAHFLAADPSNADRIYRAAELVSHVERSNFPGLWLVRSGNPTTPDTAYHVSNGCCDCPDTARVGAQNCKHALAVKMVRDIERADADRDQATPLPTREPETCYGCGSAAGIVTYYTDGVRHYGCAPARLTTLPAPTQCWRCQREPAIAPDGSGALCLAAELFGEAL